MKLKYFQKGFNFSQDGPGNRLVYHLQGCNLKCPWCANPEGISTEGTLISTDKLNSIYCPKNAISNGEINRSICKKCDKPCIRIPASGIKMSYAEEENTDILTYIKTCRMMFFDGGGVTFTGGEPTIQFDALKELLTMLKLEGINTAVESNATHIRLPELFDRIDYLIMDCKHYDSDIHNSVCGIPLDTIIESISAACKTRNQLLIRIPLIGGFNSTSQDAERFAELFERISTEICTFEFLRYHEFGKNKYARCGMKYTMTQDAKLSPETISVFTEVFKNHSLKTIHT